MSSSSSNDIGIIWGLWTFGGGLAAILNMLTHNVPVLSVTVFWLLFALGLIATYLAIALTWSAWKNLRADR
ncbi:hypothetical protein PV350_16875 [Streptomyces sp. PA03-6a]|nr:hypothetical protein [Streptomyces sp. PA03-6a]